MKTIRPSRVVKSTESSSTLIILGLCVFLSWSYVSAQSRKWVGTWSTAPQLVETANNPPAPGLSNNSLRQIVRVSLGGDTIRVHFANIFSASPVTFHSVQIAVSTGGSAIDIATNKELKFDGNAQVTMNPGVAVISDPIAFPLTPRMTVAITIYYGQTSSSVTGHPGSRTTSYIIAGNTTTVTDFTGAVTTEHWYNITGIDVLAPSAAACVVILGNSITDGRGSTTNFQNRWPDTFSERLLNNAATRHVGVLNQGIGGNAILAGGLGPPAVSRFDRDIVNQSGVRWAIVFEGVNDIGGVRSDTAATRVAGGLINAYKQFISKAHAKNIRIYGATIMPFKGNGYYNVYSEECRETVNQWIRTPGHYDAYIDFDMVMRNPADTLSIIASYQHDGLHPDSTGHRTMGSSIPVGMFAGGDTTYTGASIFEEFKKTKGIDWGQNHFNPSDSATTISFNLPKQSFVTLDVCDSLGRVVARLLSEQMPAGTHSRQWEASRATSGTYFYTLTAGELKETRRFILSK